MAEKNKGTVVLYEVPHLPEKQDFILKAVNELKKDGFRVVMQNPQLYGGEVFPDAKLIAMFGKSYTPRFSEIERACKAAGVKVLEIADHVGEVLKTLGLVEEKPKPKSKPASYKKDVAE